MLELLCKIIIVKSGAILMSIGWSSQCRAFHRAVNYEKLLHPPFPIGVDGAVAIND